jgi:hypothetical protein
MKEAAAVKDQTTLRFDLTGGEPFLDFEGLLDLVRFGAGLGAQVTCVTNAYWATSSERAESLLTQLKSAGLWSISVSTSRHHVQFVPLKRVQLALALARTVGLTTEIKVAVMQSDNAKDGLIDQCRQQISDVDLVSGIPCHPDPSR